MQIYGFTLDYLRCFRNAMASVNKLLQVIKAEADRWIEAGDAALVALVTA